MDSAVKRLRLGLAWVLALWGVAVLLHGAVKAFSEHRALAESERARIERIEAQITKALAQALARLEEEPSQKGAVWVIADEQAPVTVKLTSRWHRSGAGYDEEQNLWVPAHGAAVTVFSGVHAIAQSSLVPRAPVWFQGRSDDLGPFVSPLPRVVEGEVRLASGELKPGSYHTVIVAQSASIELSPEQNGDRNYRFRKLILEPGASLTVAPRKACPAVLFIEEKLELQGENRLNWTAEGGAPSAMLQIYGGPSASAKVSSSSKLSLVLACPDIELDHSLLHGAVAAQQLQEQASEVRFEEALRGVPLQGLGPWQVWEKDL